MDERKCPPDYNGGFCADYNVNCDACWAQWEQEHKVQDTFFVSNANAVKIKITNADRIRSMTNAELARFFDNIETKNYFGEYLGELGWLEWLQQEV